MEQKIMVSINCTTYNQEDYIEDAIKSFLSQKTNFKYEILIHDDASTDKTTEIIKEYEKKYPDIIKPIYQQENKYSKGIKVGYEYNFKRAKGKYIAICEGDDYWIDKYKLQKQVDYMESNPNCTLCVHSVKKINAINGRLIGLIRPYKLNKKCKVEDFIIGGGGFVGTNSLLYPKAVFENPPKWYFECPIGDYPMQIYLSSKGYAYYIDENMSVYRSNAKNSWTESRLKLSCEKKIQHLDKINLMLDEVNIDTNKKYDKVIKEKKLVNEFEKNLLREDFKILKEEKFKNIYFNLDKKVKVKLFIKQYFPWVNQFVQSLRSKL